MPKVEIQKWVLANDFEYNLYLPAKQWQFYKKYMVRKKNEWDLYFIGGIEQEYWSCRNLFI